MARYHDERLPPREYVQENQRQLEQLIKHSNNDFVRALAIAAFIEYGEDASAESINEDLERMRDWKENR